MREREIVVHNLWTQAKVLKTDEMSGMTGHLDLEARIILYYSPK
jgi:hypothetical protein